MKIMINSRHHADAYKQQSHTPARGPPGPPARGGFPKSTPHFTLLTILDQSVCWAGRVWRCWRTMASATMEGCSRSVEEVSEEQFLDNASEDQFLDRVIAKLRKPHVEFLSAFEIEKLAKIGVKSLSSQETLVQIESPINVCGDTHGQFKVLRTLLNAVGWPPQSRYLFLGDYVDRGDWGVEVFCLLLALKARYPDAVYLLRGNHEDASLNVEYGFKKECLRHYALDIWLTFIEVFAYLPLCAVISGRIFCIHGGISPIIKDFDSIRRITRPIKNVPDRGIVCDLLWADPSNSSQSWCDNTDRGVSVVFNEKALDQFCNKFDVDLVIRAHEVTAGGVKVFGKKKQLVTVYTCLGRGERTIGVVRVENDLACYCQGYQFEARPTQKPWIRKTRNAIESKKMQSAV